MIFFEALLELIERVGGSGPIITDLRSKRFIK